MDVTWGGRGGAGHVLDASGAFGEARDAGHADAAGGEAGGLRRLSGRSLLRRAPATAEIRLSRHLHGQEPAKGRAGSLGLPKDCERVLSTRRRRSRREFSAATPAISPAVKATKRIRFTERDRLLTSGRGRFTTPPSVPLVRSHRIERLLCCTGKGPRRTDKSEKIDRHLEAPRYDRPHVVCDWK